MCGAVRMGADMDGVRWLVGLGFSSLAPICLDLIWDFPGFDTSKHLILKIS